MAFPDATNTGVPEGTSLTRSTGILHISEDNTVIDGMEIVGNMVIDAENATIQNSKIVSGTPWHAIHVTDNGGGFTLMDSEIDGGGSTVNGAVIVDPTEPSGDSSADSDEESTPPVIATPEVEEPTSGSDTTVDENAGEPTNGSDQANPGNKFHEWLGNGKAWWRSADNLAQDAFSFDNVLSSPSKGASDYADASSDATHHWDSVASSNAWEKLTSGAKDLAVAAESHTSASGGWADHLDWFAQNHSSTNGDFSA